MESTLEKALLKKTPCNECRKRKRKCSYEQPCERCKKLNIQCNYTVIASPIDLEYMQELEYVKQVQELEEQICMMEKEMNSILLAQDKNALERISNIQEEEVGSTLQLPTVTDYPSPISMEYRPTPSPKITELTIESEKYFKMHPFYHHHHHHQHHLVEKSYYNQDHYNDHDRTFYSKNKHHYSKEKKHSHLIAKSGKYKVLLSQQDENKEEKRQNWMLTVNKEGGMTINTFITSHAELLDNLKDVLFAVNATEAPKSTPSYSSNSYITSAISSFLWKSYGKQRIKNMTKSFKIDYYNATAVTRISDHKNLTNITLKIIHAYMNCVHLSQFFLHMPYFLTHYIDEYSLDSIQQSPAVMALCSAICLLPCKHITVFIPSDAYSDYALYYFDQARELISEKFDEMTLETMVTFSFMAYYKLKLKEFNEGLRYIEMAKRIYSTLEPIYQNETNKSYAFIMLQRMNRCIRVESDTAFMHEIIARGGPHKYGGRHYFVELLKGNDVIPVIASDKDTLKEKEFILFMQHKANLQQQLHSVLVGKPISNTLSSCVGEFSHKMEMALRDWYRNQLPERFQLSLPLFEDSLSDLAFFTILEEESTETPKLLCAITLYNEYLLMAKAYVPKNPNEDFPSVDALIERFNALEAQNRFGDPLPPPRTTVRWEKFLYRIIHFKRFHQPFDATFEGTEEEYLRQLLEAVQLEDMNFNMPVATVSIISALNLVRLAQFLITREDACFLEYKWLMNAWEILLRASRFKYNNKAITLQRIRANMLMCMNIMRQHPIYEKVKGIDHVLMKLQEEFDECIV